MASDLSAAYVEVHTVGGVECRGPPLDSPPSLGDSVCGGGESYFLMANSKSKANNGRFLLKRKRAFVPQREEFCHGWEMWFQWLTVMGIFDSTHLSSVPVVDRSGTFGFRAPKSSSSG